MRKNPHLAKRLTLGNSETVRVLSERGLEGVHGGSNQPVTTNGWSCGGACSHSGFLSCKDPTVNPIYPIGEN